jgi:hypothetical protein
MAKEYTGRTTKGEWQIDHVRAAGSKGGDVWRVSHDGKVREIATSKASTRAMDQAVEKYGRALKRLADR